MLETCVDGPSVLFLKLPPCVTLPYRPFDGPLMDLLRAAGRWSTMPVDHCPREKDSDREREGEGERERLSENLNVCVCVCVCVCVWGGASGTPRRRY